MEREILSLEKFREFKSRLVSLINTAEKFYEENKNNEEVVMTFMDETRKNYLAIQEELFSYNLSLVPFEEWSGIEIMGIANLAGTSANIDFAILNYSGMGNFHGCNVRNLEYIKRRIDERDFDETTIKNNSKLFLSKNFSTEFRYKYYNGSLKFSDIVTLSSDQWNELNEKEFNNRLNLDYWELRLFEILEFEKIRAIYNYSKEDLELLVQTLEYSSMHVGDVDELGKSNFSLELKTIEVNEINNWCMEYIKNSLFKPSYSKVDVEALPKLFVENNKKMLLMDENIPEDLKEKYYARDLKIQEVIDNIDLFEGIQIEFFIGENKYDVLDLAKTVGFDNLNKLIKKYPNVIKYFIENNQVYNFTQYYHRKTDLDASFKETLKEYIVNVKYPEEFKEMNFEFIQNIETLDELVNYNDLTIIMNESQRHLINLFGIENIKQFEQETGFFSHKENINSNELTMFNAMDVFFKANHSSREKLERVLKNVTLNYDNFKEILAMYLDEMRGNNVFTDYPNYDWMQGKFRDEHPELFINSNAPENLKKAFYKNKITPEFLFNNKEIIPYLLDKDLSNTIKANITLTLLDEISLALPRKINFIQEYAKRYGNEKTLQLIVKYGEALNQLIIPISYRELDNEELIENNIRKAIYLKIINQQYGYEHLAKVPEFINEYPELFINLDSVINMTTKEKEIITGKFYDGLLKFGDIRRHPELKEVLKDKNLLVVFDTYSMGKMDKVNNKSFQEKLLDRLGNEKFLDLCITYGNYLQYVNDYDFLEIMNIYENETSENKFLDNTGQEISFDKLKLLIEKVIAKKCKDANILYTEKAPEFLKRDYPKLFIDEEAPEILKKYFYGYDNKLMSFEILKQHKEWLPYLKNKSVSTSILRTMGYSSILKTTWNKYFETFGNDKGIKLGINRTETVTKMIEANQVELMKQWYDKTGGRFIPDYVVMQNFSIDEVDKFLVSGNNWSTLMRIDKYAKNTETRDAMLKLAYTFGAFDQDKRGFNQLQELLIGAPRKIDAEYGYIIERIDKDINSHSQRDSFFKTIAVKDPDGNVKYEPLGTNKEEKEIIYQQMLEYVKSKQFNFLIDTNILVDLLEAINKEFDEFEFSKNIFGQLYRKNEDGSYTLTINQQMYPKTSQVMRNILERFRELPLLSPDKAHQLCSGFELRYDPDFREFFLNNLLEIVNNYDYTTYLSSIQKQFQKIKVANSNRTLTLDLAVSYVQSNKYDNVNPGNEHLAEISAIAGYNQQDFEKLQEIYNYGKQRTFSSIPRIKKNTGKYSYEMLRLDDPLALAIGTLTDCCQELGNVAEMCMQHSMVDNNGRIFIIRDNEGNIISQSWVWRNKNVLCFDNIEIPDKVLARISRNEKNNERRKFTDEIYGIYETAAQDLITTDEKKYKELLEQGKITKEQYEQLRLGKITVGIGYNDIAESLKRKAVFDDSELAHPLPFLPPVNLLHGLYTADSSTQYVIAKSDNQIENTNENTLNIYNDSYVEYDDNNFTEKLLLMLKKLEIITNGDKFEERFDNKIDNKHIVTSLARNYRLNPEKTKIIMNANMAIIYEVQDKKIKLGNLLFNTNVNNGEQQLDIEMVVGLQIWLAFEQIKGDKEFDISLLNDKQKDMYDKVIKIVQDFNLESGVGHGR